MKVDEIEVSSEDILSIQKAVQKREKVMFNCYTLTPAQKQRFLQILKVFLQECNQDYLYNCLSYCLLELLDNASKANAKRIYFQENNLDINNEKDYKNGMKDFKANLSTNSKHFMEELEAGKLQVNLSLSIDNVICLQVLNNTKITKSEFKRINEKIEKTKKYESLQDAFCDIDQTEGSGLGIISIILMLKKLGLDTTNLEFAVTEEDTVATIRVPADSIFNLEEI